MGSGGLDLSVCLAASSDDLVLNRLRNLLEAERLHRVLSTALRFRTHIGCISEHFRERNLRDDLGNALAVVIHGLNSTAARVEVADDIAEIIVRGDGGDLHDRLGENRVCLLHSFLESHGAGDLSEPA